MKAVNLETMDEARANRMVQALADYGIGARVERSGVYQFGIAIRLDTERVAIWDSDGTAGLEAQVMSNGMLVGFVPTIPGSADFTEEQSVAAIARTDYDAQSAHSARTVRSSSPEASRPHSDRQQGRPGPRPAPPSATPAGGGVLRRLFKGR